MYYNLPDEHKFDLSSINMKFPYLHISLREKKVQTNLSSLKTWEWNTEMCFGSLMKSVEIKLKSAIVLET